MPFLNCTTFGTCPDNNKAAKAFLAGLKAAGHSGELVEVAEATVKHALDNGAPSAPAAVSHDAPADVSVPLSIEIETAHGGGDVDVDEPRERFRGASSSPVGPFGGPPPDRT